MKQAIFLDWAMAQWKSILEPLEELLVPGHVEEVVMAACDIGYPLDDGAHNGVARRVLEATTPASDERRVEAHPLDLVIVSYLLAETRDRWHRLLDDIIPATRLVLLLDISVVVVKLCDQV